MMGRHAIKHWSSTQASIALSSGGAEFAGVVRGSGQGLGYQALLQDLGFALPVRVWTDSSAAIGIVNREGLGRTGHIQVQYLWLQQGLNAGSLKIKKVSAQKNIAELFTI